MTRKVTEAVGGTPCYMAPEIFEQFSNFSSVEVEIDEEDSVIEPEVGGGAASRHLGPRICPLRTVRH